MALTTCESKRLVNAGNWKSQAIGDAARRGIVRAARAFESQFSGVG